MKAEERKEIETNSLVLAVQRFRKHASGRTLYYVLGTAALVLGGILLYRYFDSDWQKTRDETIRQLAAADTADKLKEGMEQHRGSVYGSLFKLHLARHHLGNEGLPRLGTDAPRGRQQAANSVQEARTYFIELTNELKDEPALVQEAWLGAAQAESALVGLPTAEDKTDSRGDVDNVIKYYENAAAIFPDRDFSKQYKERAEKLKATKDQFVKDQQEIYKPRDLSSFSPPPGGPPLGKGDLPFPSLPFGPGPERSAGIPPPPPPDYPKPADPPKGGDPKAK